MEFFLTADKARLVPCQGLRSSDDNRYSLSKLSAHLNNNCGEFQHQVAVFLNHLRYLRFAVSRRQDTVFDLAAALDGVLRNPYGPAARQKRLEMEERKLILRSDAEADAWVGWWQRLPSVLQDGKSVLALMVTSAHGVAHPTERIKRIHSALTSRRSGEYVAAAELACRNLEFCKVLDSMVGDTVAMRQVRYDTWAAAFGESLAVTQGRAPLIHRTPVRIHGETGTGKELIAQALSKAEPGTWNAQTGRWSPAPFEAVNLASIPVNLVAGALFGYEAGSHSTAPKPKEGILKQCHKGAVFLDEIAELPLPTQVALLRCLQEGKVRPLGALHDIEAQPRIISATHQSLLRLVEEGKFRRDLYHRLSAAVISLPPLSQRLADIPLLVEHVLLAVEPAERTVLREKVRSWLARLPTNYSWPGNVRELGLAVQVLALGLEPTLEEGSADNKDALTPQQVFDGTWTLEQVKRWYAERVLKQSPSQTEAAERLDVDRGTLKKLVKSHGI